MYLLKIRKNRNCLKCSFVSATSLIVSSIFFNSVEAKNIPERTHLLINFQPQKPQEFILDNGLKLIIDVDKRAPVVAHTVWYKVGSADEQSGESGIAHFLEHLMFKGTTTYPAGYFSKHVAELGGDDNAFTTADYTGYYQNIGKEHLAEMMKMEADRMRFLKIDNDELIKERNVVLEERLLRVDNVPTAQLIEQMSSILMRNHPYGSPVIGWKHEISALSQEKITAFYKKYYAPNNAIVTVVGDVDPQEVLRLANDTYGKLERSNFIAKRQRAEEPPQIAERTISLKHHNVSVPSLFLMNEGISFVKNPKEYYALSAGLKAIAGGTHSYLYKKLVKQDKIALSIGVHTSSDRLDNSPIIFQIIPNESIRLDVLRNKFTRALEDIIQKGLTEKDIEKEKNDMIVDFISAFDSRGNKARFWGVASIMDQNLDDIRKLPQTIHDVNHQETNKILKEVFKPSNRVWGSLEKKND